VAGSGGAAPDRVVGAEGAAHDRVVGAPAAALPFDWRQADSSRGGAGRGGACAGGRGGLAGGPCNLVVIFCVWADRFVRLMHDRERWRQRPAVAPEGGRNVRTDTDLAVGM